MKDKDVDLSILNTKDDFQEYINNNCVYSPLELKKEHHRVYQKAVRLGICKNLIYPFRYYNRYPETLEFWQEFINKNNISSPADFEKRYKEYNIFRRNSSSWRDQVVYVDGYHSIRNKYEKFKTPLDFQLYINDNKIASASDLRRKDPGII